MLMVGEQEQGQEQSPTVNKITKGCQISIMFPVETDEEALAVKKAIDDALPNVKGRRYTFQIAEM